MDNKFKPHFFNEMRKSKHHNDNGRPKFLHFPLPTSHEFIQFLIETEKKNNEWHAVGRIEFQIAFFDLI